MNENQKILSIDFLKYPVISEKSMKLLDLNQYTFIVDRKSTKPEIKEIIEFLFNVNVEKVNLLTCPKKIKRTNTKKGLNFGHKTVYKKAIVHLRKTDKIDFFTEEFFQQKN